MAVKVPRQSPAAGIAPEDLPHDQISTMALAVIWVMAFVAAIFLGLRLLCKTVFRAGLWWDDHLLIASFVSLSHMLANPPMENLTIV